MKKSYAMFRSKVFYRLFLSYTLVLLLPLLALGYIAYNHAANKLQEQIEKSVSSEVANLVRRVDSLHESIAGIAIQIGRNAMFSRYRFTADEYSMMTGIEMLGNYRMNHPDLYDILLYYYGEDRLFSSRGVSSVKVLADSVYRYGDWGAEAMREDLNRSDAVTVRPAEPVWVNGNERVDLMTILMPLQALGNQHGTVVFLVKEQDLFGLSKEWIEYNQATIYLLDSQGNVLAGSGPEKHRPIGASLPRHGSGTHKWTVDIDGQPHTCIFSEPGKGNWSVLSVFPNHVVLSELALFKQAVERVLAAVLLIGIVCASMLAFLQYRPIRTIAETLISQARGGKRPNRAPASTGNELAWIRQSVDRLLEDQNELIKEEWIERLLRGDQSSERIDADILHRIRGGPQDALCYAAAVVRMEPKDDRGGVHAAKERLRQAAGAASSERWKAHVVDLVAPSSFAVLLCLFREDGRGEALDWLKKELERDRASAFAIACGKPVRELPHVNRSYIEALAALEYRVIYGDGSVILYEEIDVPSAAGLWYAPEAQMKYVQSLKQGDAEVALESLSGIMNDIRGREQSLLILKSQCCELIGAVYRTVTELQLQGYAQPLERLLAFGSLQELEEELAELTVRVCDDAAELRKNKHQVLLADIEAYLREHFNSPTISLEEIADHFRLSPSYMSRLIKEKSGKSFTGWVTEMKLEHAKRLLVHSDVPIREVSEQAGYVDYPNFMRRFKKIVGMTPGEYRKIHKVKPGQ